MTRDIPPQLVGFQTAETYVWTLNKMAQQFPICGVYFLISDGKVVYVGSSKNCYQRVHAHVSSEKEFQGYSVIPLPADLAWACEQALIGILRPEYNKIPTIPEAVPVKIMNGRNMLPEQDEIVKYLLKRVRSK